MSARKLGAAAAGSIADHRHHLAMHRALCNCRLDGLEVGAAAGHKHRQLLLLRACELGGETHSAARAAGESGGAVAEAARP